MVIEHAQLKGMSEKVNYEAITELAEYATKELGFDIPENFPIVGEHFNTTRAGIHADGLLKNEQIYNCFDTDAILKRPVKVAITDKTGAAGLKHWIETRFETQIAKDDPYITEIKKKIDNEYMKNRVSAISDEEMYKWAEETFGDNLPKRK
jgi:isopropylmalate/homocitrate/citramalate synthase